MITLHNYRFENLISYAMKACGGSGCIDPHFLTSALVGGLGRFNSRERGPGTHWIGGWVGPRADLDDVQKRKFLTLPGLGRPARSHLLYRLHCPDTYKNVHLWIINISIYWKEPRNAQEGNDLFLTMFVYLFIYVFKFYLRILSLARTIWWGVIGFLIND
jgi:hypothetical protein